MDPFEVVSVLYLDTCDRSISTLDGLLIKWYFVVIGSALFDAVDFPLLLIVDDELPFFITLRLISEATKHAFCGSLTVVCCVYSHLVLENHVKIILAGIFARFNSQILGEQVEGF